MPVSWFTKEPPQLLHSWHADQERNVVCSSRIKECCFGAQHYSTKLEWDLSCLVVVTDGNWWSCWGMQAPCGVWWTLATFGLLHETSDNKQQDERDCERPAVPMLIKRYRCRKIGRSWIEKISTRGTLASSFWSQPPQCPAHVRN